ncbi:hypothetical protein D6827_01170, partial [Candidatus Parcubacteria bacterium]
MEKQDGVLLLYMSKKYPKNERHTRVGENQGEVVTENRKSEKIQRKIEGILAEFGKDNPVSNIEAALSQAEEVAERAGVSGDLLELVSDYFKTYALYDPDVAERLVDWVRAVKIAPEEEIVKAYLESGKVLLENDLKKKLNKLMQAQKTGDGRPIRARLAKERRRKADNIKEIFDSNPIAAVRELESVLHDYGIDEGVPPLPDFGVEKEKRKKERLFKDMLARVKAKVEAYLAIEKNAAALRQEIENKLQEAQEKFKQDPDEALRFVQDLHNDLEVAEPSQEQFISLVGRYRKILSYPFLDKSLRNELENFVKIQEEAFSKNSIAAFSELMQRWPAIEKIDEFAKLYYQARELKARIMGAENFEALSN